MKTVLLKTKYFVCLSCFSLKHTQTTMSNKCVELWTIINYKPQRVKHQFLCFCHHINVKWMEQTVGQQLIYTNVNTFSCLSHCFFLPPQLKVTWTLWRLDSAARTNCKNKFFFFFFSVSVLLGISHEHWNILLKASLYNELWTYL